MIIWMKKWFCTVTTAIEAKGGEILPLVVRLAHLAKSGEIPAMLPLMETDDKWYNKAHSDLKAYV